MAGRPTPRGECRSSTTADRILVEPFIGFIDLGKDATSEPAEDIDDRLDEAAAAIPRAILLLRKLANIRAARPKPGPPRAGPLDKSWPQ
jgi:uncharacterized protein